MRVRDDLPTATSRGKVELTCLRDCLGDGATGEGVGVKTHSCPDPSRGKVDITCLRDSLGDGATGTTAEPAFAGRGSGNPGTRVDFD